MAGNGGLGQSPGNSAIALPSGAIQALLDRWREDARVLRKRGAVGQAEGLEQCLAELVEALEGTGNNVMANEGKKPVPYLPDRLLSAEEVAERLGTTPGWVYAHWRKRLPFGQKLSHKVLRFSAAKLERHLAGSRGAA